jgi:hypothetical protein
MHRPGVVDRVYHGIHNADGYEIRKMLLRSECFPNIGDKFCCCDDQTEILTDKGWIFFKDLKMTHKVATLMHDTTLMYQHPLAIQEYDYDGKMYKVDSNQVDLVVTPNHKMYVKPHGAKHHRVELARDIHGKIVQYKKDAEHMIPCDIESKFIKKPVVHTGCQIDGYKFILPEYGNYEPRELDLNAWLEFFGIWIAEGCTLRDWAVSIATHKQRVKERMEVVCKILGFKINKHKDKVDDDVKNAWCIPDNQLVGYIRPFSVGAVNKSLPKWVWSLNKEQSRVLINGMMLGDGHQMKGTTTRRYDTSSKQLADDFQRLCLHAGYATNICLKYKAGHTSEIVNGKRKGEKITSTVDAYRMSVIETQLCPKVNKNKKTNQQDSFVDYKGKVYCCTAVGYNKNSKEEYFITGVLYVRRNGVPVWSCNSRHGQKGTIGITMDGADMPFTGLGIQPDIILNPHAIPSRMTIGHLVECLAGKCGALEGSDVDGTPFEEHDIESFKRKLESLGYERNGYEWLYNGMTGERLKTMIYIGPTYYQRLKHLVEDKIHSRSRGPRTLLTRQALAQPQSQ